MQINLSGVELWKIAMEINQVGVEFWKIGTKINQADVEFWKIGTKINQDLLAVSTSSDICLIENLQCYINDEMNPGYGWEVNFNKKFCQHFIFIIAPS